MRNNFRRADKSFESLVFKFWVQDSSMWRTLRPSAGQAQQEWLSEWVSPRRTDDFEIITVSGIGLSLIAFGQM